MVALKIIIVIKASQHNLTNSVNYIDAHIQYNSRLLYTYMHIIHNLKIRSHK